MPIVEITRSKSWMKRTGSLFSDIWNYLANIQYLLQNQMISTSTRLVVYTVKMVEADKEYSQKLPEHTKGYTAHVSDGTAFRIQIEPGRVAGANRPYWTVPINTSDTENYLNLTNTILYFACSTANKTMEIKVKV